MVTNKYYIIDLTNLSEEKIMQVFRKEMHFGEKALNNKTLGIILPEDYLNHLLSWLLGFQQKFYPKILLSYLID